MPEGDSLRRIANQLAPLVGQTIERATTQGLERAALADRAVTAVDAYGKHLLIDLDHGTQIRTHLGMTGRVRSYARGNEPHISPGRASLLLVTASHVYLWVTAKRIEIAARRAPMRGHAIAQLGPDVLAGDFDCRQAASRAALHDSRMIADVLLDQRVVAGIGNIYKSEALFRCRVDPRTRIRDLGEHQLVEIYAEAHRLMAASVAGTPEPHRAYSRTNKPCPRCGTPISAYQLGDPPRWTWSCATCQVHGTATASSR
jgi:endonuclease-8